MPCPPLGLRFVIDRAYDARTMYAMLRGDDPAGPVSRAASMGIAPELADAIRGATSYDAVAERVEAAVEARHATSDLSRARAAYEAAWASLVDPFSDRVTSVTARGWIHPEYTVVVSAFHRGVSNWRGHVVAARFDHELAMKRRIVAHELVLSQVFQLVRSRHPQEELGDRSVWAFAEITAVLVLEDAPLRPYWPEVRRESYFATSNYPQLAPLEAELRRRFDARTSFDDYLSASIGPDRTC